MQIGWPIRIPDWISYQHNFHFGLPITTKMCPWTNWWPDIEHDSPDVGHESKTTSNCPKFPLARFRLRCPGPVRKLLRRHGRNMFTNHVSRNCKCKGCKSPKLLSASEFAHCCLRNKTPTQIRQKHWKFQITWPIRFPTNTAPNRMFEHFNLIMTASTYILANWRAGIGNDYQDCKQELELVSDIPTISVGIVIASKPRTRTTIY